MEIVHDTRLCKFYSVLDGQEAYLNYSVTGDGTLDFYHTYVPSSLRGPGIASTIVKEALQYAAEQHSQVIPSCWYVALFFKRHPEYADLHAPRGVDR